MGAVRHRQLIQVLAAFVALDMAVGVVALSARRDGRDAVRTTLVAGSVGIPIKEESGTGILAGANLKERRNSNDRPGSTGSFEAAPTTAPPATAASTQATIPAPSATPTSVRSQAATGTERGGAGSTGATPVTTRSPGSTMTVQPAPPSSTTTNQPAPASGTTATTRPSATTAPVGAPTTTTSQPPAAGQPRGEVTLTDPAGDTFIDGTQKAINEPRADIVRAGAAYQQGILAFVMQVQQPVDPRTDERWAGNATFAGWSIDTNGDGQPDFEIQYYFLDGQLGGAVTRPDSTDVECDIESAYSPEGYSVIVDPACLGNPASVAFRVTLYYDTNPKNENADVASDVAPDGGMSFPVSRPN